MTITSKKMVGTNYTPYMYKQKIFKMPEIIRAPSYFQPLRLYVTKISTHVILKLKQLNNSY